MMRLWIAWVVLVCAGSGAFMQWKTMAAAEEQPAAQPAPPPDKSPGEGALVQLPPQRSEAAKGLAERDVESLKLDLPRPLFIGTRKEIKGTTIDPAESGSLRGAFIVPKGVTLLSRGSRVKASDENPIIGSADMVTDGTKEGTDGNFVEFGPGQQWVQIDLGARHNVYAILLWHYHAEQRVYRDVVIQVSDDPDFIDGVTTLFNNDQDNSSGLGLGKDREYIETNQGKLIDGRGAMARYVRCHSKGNTNDAQNHYIEIEVWGK